MIDFGKRTFPVNREKNGESPVVGPFSQRKRHLFSAASEKTLMRSESKITGTITEP